MHFYITCLEVLMTLSVFRSDPFLLVEVLLFQQPNIFTLLP